GEKMLVGLEEPAVDEQPRRIEQIDDGGHADGEVAAGVSELGGEVDLPRPGQGDDLVDVNVPAELARDAPGERAVAGDRFQTAGVAAAAAASVGHDSDVADLAGKA